MEILRINNLTRYFGAVPALVEVSLELQQGEVLGIVGQRGAGKSTLLQLLSGAIAPSSGEIFRRFCPKKQSRKAMGCKSRSKDL